MAASPPTTRFLASGILGEVLSKHKFASERLDHYLKLHPLDPRDKALLTQLVYGTLREMGFLDHCLGAYVDLKKTTPALQNLLRVGVYQIFFLEKIPDHAVVFETVELAKKRWGASPGKFVNAVLRRILERKETFLGARRVAQNPPSSADLPWMLSFPAWMVGRWAKRYPLAQLFALAEYFNRVPPPYLRVNLKKTSVEELIAVLGKEGVAAEQVSGSPILLLEKATDKVLQPLLKEGWGSFQDLGSFRVLEAVQAKAGEVGLDVCAGHGGKSSGIAEVLPDDSRLYVHEPLALKRTELTANFRRLGLTTPQELSGKEEALRKKILFDWILVDAPCSGAGTLGRRPEIRWRLKASDLKRHKNLQIEIVREWLPLLKSGGRLIYAVCSVEPEEGREVLESLVATEPELTLLRSEEFFPPDCRHDGFFLALFKKKQDLRA